MRPAEQMWQRKKEARNNSMIQLLDILFDNFSTQINNYHKLSTSHKLSKTKTVDIQQNNDISLQQRKLELGKDEDSETILLSDTRYQHFSRQLGRVSTTDEINTRQLYGETVNV